MLRVADLPHVSHNNTMDHLVLSRDLQRTFANTMTSNGGVLLQALGQFKDLIARADRAALNNDNAVPETLARTIRSAFRDFSELINAMIGDQSSAPILLKDALGVRLQRELLPYLLLTNAGERFYSKPRGYAGDFLTIELMYQNQPTGVGRFGRLLDQCFLELPPAVAVRNRRGLLAEEITSVLAQKRGAVAQVTSLACGPAVELFDVFARLDDPSLLAATLIDIDLQALAFVADKRDRAKLRRQMQLINANLVYLATGKQQIALNQQDLIYSIGLIDYFDDQSVIKLLHYIYGILRPGGKVILGNFHPRNPTKALMDYILDWRLIHRTEEDMDRLFASSAFGRRCTAIRFEDQGINLFAACIKE
jgi:SAM-dependent methyltransferase